MNHDEISNRSITSSNTEAVIFFLKFSAIKYPDIDGVIGESYQTLKKLRLSTSQVFYKIKKNATKLFFKASITLITKQDKDKRRRRDSTHLPNEQR